MQETGTERYLMLSGLQHLVFCERQCALIHLERVWQDNQHTVLGDYFHHNANQEGSSKQKKIRIERALPLRSDKYKLTGIADVVEFRQSKQSKAKDTWIPYPVEYKIGKAKSHRADEIQLCAQAICLMEMTGVPVGQGALYYGKTREKMVVAIDRELIELTENYIARYHQLLAEQILPKAVYGKHCHQCSLYDICMPQINTELQKDYLKQAL